MSNIMHKVKDAMTDNHDRDRAPNTEGSGETRLFPIVFYVAEEHHADER
jgi:hypothetical protein